MNHRLKVLSILGLCIALSSQASITRAAEPTMVGIVLPIYQAGKTIYQGIDLIGKIKGEFWHEWTMCEYESGFRLYNRFKSKRLSDGGLEIINYYRYWGDGDSFYGAADGNERHVQLPGDRESIESIHGPIRRIALIADPLSCKRDPVIIYVDRWNRSKLWRIDCE